MKNLIWGSVFCLFATGAFAQSNLSPLYFQSGTVLPTGFSTWNNPWNKGEIQSGKGIRIIQFAEIPSQKQIEIIQSFGIELLDYMPEKAYFASIPTSVSVETLKQNGVVAILTVNNSMKQSKELFSAQYPVWALNGKQIKLSISAYKNASVEDVEKAMQALGFRIFENQRQYQHWLVEGPISKIDDLTQINALQFL